MFHCAKERRRDETISKTFYRHETHKVLIPNMSSLIQTPDKLELNDWDKTWKKKKMLHAQILRASECKSCAMMSAYTDNFTDTWKIFRVTLLNIRRFPFDFCTGMKTWPKHWGAVWLPPCASSALTWTATNCHIAGGRRATGLCTSRRQTKQFPQKDFWLLISEKSPFPPPSEACFRNQTRRGRILDAGRTIPTGCGSSHVIEVCSLVAASVVIPLPASNWMCWRLPALPAGSIHCNVWPRERPSILKVQGPEPNAGARMQEYKGPNLASLVCVGLDQDWQSLCGKYLFMVHARLKAVKRNSETVRKLCSWLRVKQQF